MRVPADVLTDHAVEILTAAGSGSAEARVVADHLVGANLVGHDSHGVIRIPSYLAAVQNDQVRPNQSATAVLDTGSICVFDGGRGFGQAIGAQALDIAIAKCRQHGLALMGIRNTGHLGRIGHWAERAAAAGFVSFHCVNTSGAGILVAPFGGREARLSANPLAFGVPVPGRAPMILDMSTASIAHGKIMVAANAKTTLPDNCVTDHTGRVTRDPAAYMGPPVGAILPIGGHKGHGLSIMIEILAGALTGGHCSNPEHGAFLANNMFSLLLDPDLMGAGAAFGSELNALEEWIKSSAPAVDVPGDIHGGILMPGEIEQRTRAERLANGIPLDDETWRQLTDAGRADTEGG